MFGKTSTKRFFYKLPIIKNEPLLNYSPGSTERTLLLDAIHEIQSKIHKVPCVVNGQKIYGTDLKSTQIICSDHSKVLCEFHGANRALISKAIDGALEAKMDWEAMPFHEKASIFMKAADLLSTKYRYKVMAATILGQGKNAWQAEIDSAAELADFWRFNCKFAEKIQDIQPDSPPGTWNKMEYRPLEGFVGAISPFNFTAIGGNLASAPALMGNVVLWKPSSSAVFSNWLVYQILEEAGLPKGVIQFVPGPSQDIANQIIDHPNFGGLHFTGSTAVFKDLWKRASSNLDKYKSYPRLVGETGGKNFHFIHNSADLLNAVHSTIRGAFEYQGQKCSATSRCYIPSSIWPAFKKELLKSVRDLSVGPEIHSFCGPVINKSSFNKIKSYIDDAKRNGDIVVGGECDDSQGYFIHPTIIQTTNPRSKTMTEEIFGPVLTIFVYPDAEYEKYLQVASDTSPYGLTGSIFAQDRQALKLANDILKHSAGNFYVNDKSTGAIVNQQPFGGARQSGTNDKAGSILNLYRWISPRTIKESFTPIKHFSYPSNQK